MVWASWDFYKKKKGWAKYTKLRIGMKNDDHAA
jgi:hypothetical protein